MERRWCLLAVACCCALPAAACGQSDGARVGRAARAPAPAPRTVLTAGERERWAPRPPDRSRVPVLLYSSVAPAEFAHQMALLDHAGYETITLQDLVRFIERRRVRLPARPLLLTFDGGRLDAWTGSEAILRELGFNAVVFVDVGRVEQGDDAYLTWQELGRLQRSGRWDVQLQSGSGNRRIRYGPAPDDVGAFYAYRGANEVLGGWRERVFSDVTDAERQLAHHVPGYRPLAFAPPYGNYGQAGTNDPSIPRELLARLLLSFKVVFTQDRSGFAAPDAPNPIGRIEVTRAVGASDLRALLRAPPRR